MTEEGRFLIVEKELKAIPLPAIYKREGKECYYDTYRKKLIEITPEETVRQRVAAYFENECGVPKEMILSFRTFIHTPLLSQALL